MSLDPREDVMRAAGPDPVARLEADVKELKRRLDAQRNAPTVPRGQGPPSTPPTDGVFYIDTLNNRLYVAVAGAWRFVALT